MDLGLKEKHVFVAGSSRGLGYAIAKRFLDEGAKLALTARSAGPLETVYAEFAAQAGEDRVFRMSGDLTQTDTITAVIDAAERALGPIHTVVANVGLDNSPYGFDVADEFWDSGLNQNFLGSMRLAREALRRATARDEDQRQVFNIVFISSAAGVEALGTALSYGSAKAALNHGARELARLMGRQGIRVNVVAPGNFLVPGGTLERMMVRWPHARERLLKHDIALGRFGKAEELADVVAFLASPRAAYVTGAVWVVDGGQLRH